MRILIATDAWDPQVNGVVRTLKRTTEALRRAGHEVFLFSTEGRRTWPLPLYPEIRVALEGRWSTATVIEAIRPEAIHIATEGPLGWAARAWCLRRRKPFTTGVHTKFPEFIAARLPMPGIVPMGYALLRRFHAPSQAVMAPTRRVAEDLATSGFRRVCVWTRGVDRELFRPGPRDALGLPRPILLVAGRVSVEKNLDDFLKLDVPGTKVVVGDGPALADLKRRYPSAVFTGYLHNGALARTVAAADVFVFPSRLDTFGLVMLEAMACGVPVAAYPVPGPIDVVVHGKTGYLDEDLTKAVGGALSLDGSTCREHALSFTWEKTAELFLSYLAPFSWPTIRSATRA
jgi:glycosyltransferase involved in cell wall biosynthesis